MAKSLNDKDFQDCLKRGKIKKFSEAKSLTVAEKLLDVRLIEAMQMAKTLRENADYDNEFSQSSAEVLVEKAQAFLEKAEELLQN